MLGRQPTETFELVETVGDFRCRTRRKLACRCKRLLTHLLFKQIDEAYGPWARGDDLGNIDLGQKFI